MGVGGGGYLSFTSMLEMDHKVALVSMSRSDLRLKIQFELHEQRTQTLVWRASYIWPSDSSGRVKTRTSQVICFCSDEPATAARIARITALESMLIRPALLWVLIFHGSQNKSAYFTPSDPQINRVGSLQEWDEIVPSCSEKPQKNKKKKKQIRSCKQWLMLLWGLVWMLL